MCTVTLSFNEKDKVASEKLAALLSTGLFVQLNRQEDLNVDYADPTLYEDSVPMPEEKDYYSPEELREILVSDLNEIYGVKEFMMPAISKTCTINEKLIYRVIDSYN